MTITNNLYYGNIAPHEYEVVRGSEYDITAKLVIRHEQELSATLTEQQNTILQKIKDNHTELINLGERDAFRRGLVVPIHPVFCQPAIALEHTLRKNNINVINRMTDAPNIGNILCSGTEQEIMKMNFVQHTLDKRHTDLEGMVNVFAAKYFINGSCKLL